MLWNARCQSIWNILDVLIFKQPLKTFSSNLNNTASKHQRTIQLSNEWQLKQQVTNEQLCSWAALLLCKLWVHFYLTLTLTTVSTRCKINVKTLLQAHNNKVRTKIFSTKNITTSGICQSNINTEIRNILEQS